MEMGGFVPSYEIAAIRQKAPTLIATTSTGQESSEQDLVYDPFAGSIQKLDASRSL
jgi:hypothetical protein